MDTTFLTSLESIFSTANLEAGFFRIHSETVGIDGVSVLEYKARLSHNIEKLRESLLMGSYAPEPMLRFKLPKDGGGFRPIAVSSVKDKIVQNALSAALLGYFDKTFSNASYAYRPGKSHIRAIHRARDYISQGYVYALKTDIESFFENINHDILLSILDKNIADKRITRLISLLLQNGLFERQNYDAHVLGVHQGDSLSPLLSNIYLDAMDKFLESRSIVFVRYADDFVTLGKTSEETQRAKRELDEYLPAIGLKLNSQKTKLLDSKDGFTFLGAYFRGKEIFIDRDTLQKQTTRISKLSKTKLSFENYISKLNETIKSVKRYLLQIVAENSPQIAHIENALIESLGSKIAISRQKREITTKAAFREKLSKLEHLSKDGESLINRALIKAYGATEEPKEIKADTKPLEKKKREYAQRYAKSSTLLIGRFGAFLGISKFSFSIRENGKPIKHIPINQIKNIVVSTKNAAFSSAVVEACAKNGISIDFIDDKNGHYAQLISFNASVSELALKQIRLIQNGEHIYLAKEFVVAKSKNQLNYLKYIDRYHGKLTAHIASITKSFEALKNNSNGGQAQLMGYEGEISATYWSAVKTLLGEDKFCGRTTRGANDAVNSALNYGYAILYGRAQKALVKAGLALHISFLHSIDGRKPTLAFDFVEEFRAYVVDKTVIAMASKSDVLAVKDGWLTESAKKTLAEEILARLGGYVSWKKRSVRMDDIIEEQAYLLARHVKGEAKYNAFIGKY